MVSTGRKRLTEPLESVTAFFGWLMIFAVLAIIGFTVFGPSGTGIASSDVCVTQPGTQFGSSQWQFDPAMAVARPGNSLTVNGTLQACANHPAIFQRVLYVATALPKIVFWAGLLLLLWRMITVASRGGTFTPRVAKAMRRLGWFVIAGTAAVSIVQLLAVDWLLVTMARLNDSPFTNLIWLPARDLVPGAILAGAALLTFARIIRVGAAMEDEIKGTI
jgi:hypothetical protein